MAILPPGPRLDAISDYYAAALELSADETDCLREILGSAIRKPAKSSLIEGGASPKKPQIILSGWAMEVLFFSDGREQVVDFSLPGDVVGYSWYKGTAVPASHVAVTDVVLTESGNDLSSKAASVLRKICAAIDRDRERRFYQKIAALGQSASERFASLILDFHERLSRFKQVKEQTFDLPITQEIIAEALGMSTVHANRVVQRFRSARIIASHPGQMTILQFQKLVSASNPAL